MMLALRLVEAGLLRRADIRMAGIVPVTRYPVVAPDASRRLQDDVRTWLGDASGAAPDSRTACLVALLGACGLLGRVTTGLGERRHASARARAAMRDDPAARAVKAIVDEVYAVTVGAAVVVLGV
jgi:hypothetical protein